jgi:hypothetical protein
MKFIGLISILFLSACNPFERFKPDSQDIVTSRWAKNQEKPEEVKKIYSYKTLGDIMYYDKPLRDSIEREVVSQ